MALSLTSSPAIENDSLSPKETIEHHYNALLRIVNNSRDLDESAFEQQVFQMVEKLFDIPKLSAMALGSKWPKLNAIEQKRFIETMKIALQKDILKQIDRYGVNRLPSIELISEEAKENFSKLRYLVSGNQGKKEFTIFMLKSSDTDWKISNIIFGKKSLIREYYSICEKLTKQYSLAYLEAELTGRGYVVLEDFEADEVGKLPKDWSWRNRDNNKNKPYVVMEENGNKYLAADDNGESVILGKNIKWNLKKYPYISFKWRARNLPDGGDERFGQTVDSAAGLYIVYKKKLGLIPESVKYVWSTTLPVGSTMRRSGTGKPWMIVAESGDEHLGEWRTFVFNVYEAYKKTFGGNPPKTAIAIGILSDANSTNSKAYADYDDIKALKSADADSGVKKILDAE
jgi:ABC-type transporter MlaC component